MKFKVSGRTTCVGYKFVAITLPNGPSSQTPIMMSEVDFMNGYELEPVFLPETGQAASNEPDVYAEILRERNYQKSLGTEGLDNRNTPSDWVATIAAYAGAGVHTFSQTEPDFRKAMVKVAAIAVAAIESFDRAVG